MANPIVIVNVNQIVAPTPNTLQQTGAFISQGGTTLSDGTYSLLTQLADLTPILAAPLAVTSLAWSGGTVTATTTAAHGITSGDEFLTTISGATPAVYNGTVLATATGASTFTYALASDGGTTPATGTIKYTPRNSAELVAMATTFFAQGANTAVYVLELGAGEPADGVTALGDFITASPQFFYAYLVPRSWDGVSQFLAFVAEFESNTAKTYFYVTTTTDTYDSYTTLMKSVFLQVEAPTIPTTEFTMAADFFTLLHYQPSSTNKVTPFEYTFVFDVTPYPQIGNAALLAELTAANVSYIGTGAEGGISDAIIFGGNYADGNPVNYWYAIDWAAINTNLNVSNAVINGSNNPTNPLYYNQPGINRLEAVAASTMASGITFGMVLNPVIQLELTSSQLGAAIDAGTYDNFTIVNAVPFVSYTKDNPGDYKIGKYAGYTIVFTPLRGFDKIIFNLDATNFA
jgi:hypothetical protein